MSDPQPESNPIDPAVEDPALSSEISPPVEAAAPPKREKRTFRPKPRVSPQVTSPYAVIETGGKQYRVSVGDTITVERLPDDAGDELSIDRVLLLGGDGSTRIGTPTVEGALVTAKIDDHFRGEKIVVFKYKAKKRYRRRTGHRQSLTHLTITNIAS
ncbi:MAG: 50S ribosomal protein L21 [Chloroflexia bacterium]|nr:50S ribosomal protein L21 [Chloroflexia bacterium]